MAHIYERVVNLISKPPEKRHDRDIDLLISWFQNMSGLFKAQKTDVVKDIVRNCKFLSLPEDSVIIKQGDQGDSFYIILSGLVSIYINQQLEEQGNLTKSTPVRQRKKRLDNEARRVVSEKKTLLNENEIKNGDSDSRVGSKDTSDNDSQQMCDSGVSEMSFDDAMLSDDSSVDYSDSESSHFNYRKNAEKLDRKQFGVHIRELGIGKSFGELALVQADNVRSASIISDLPTDLIMVNRDLYNRCLKTAQEMQFKEKKEFVGTCSLFSNWTPRQRKIMAMSFTKTRYDYDNTIVKQGEPVRGIFFILNGNVKHSVDPLHHVKQYPSYSSNEDQAVTHALRRGKVPHDRKPADVNNNNQRMAGPSFARRRNGYAEAEKLATRKFVDICTVGPSESIGDLEVILRLPTYLQTVTCLGPVEVFELDLNNFERQIVKRSPKTFVNMRALAQVKLNSRMQRLHNQQVYTPVMKKMLEKMEEISIASQKKIPRQKAEDDSVLFNQGWYKYRLRQRQFLRRRERERQLFELKRMQMQHTKFEWQQRMNSTQQQNLYQQPAARVQDLTLGLRARSFSDGATRDITPVPMLPDVPQTPVLSSKPIVIDSVSSSELSSDSGIALTETQINSKPRSTSISHVQTVLPKLETRPRTANEV
ncbi:uncharacterized protein LOC117119699 [Anneissia japonica]|uniref:uncharacterized protein LOC117119699 n=1 Tax=Anneissia japonica TaxID=1529436 RepID=UPI0014258E24|nr:uncharacterized protein LOC117119699 [Anneissia japonica]XP_033120426.1 uncharacterized protein LOC117119699 [Anneissia japonica]